MRELQGHQRLVSASGEKKRHCRKRRGKDGRGLGPERKGNFLLPEGIKEKETDVRPKKCNMPSGTKKLVQKATAIRQARAPRAVKMRAVCVRRRKERRFVQEGDRAGGSAETSHHLHP